MIGVLIAARWTPDPRPTADSGSLRRRRHGMIGAFWAPALVTAILVLLYAFDVARL